MFLVIDPSSAVPAYVQIVEQIKRAIAAGILRPGEALPSLRETALKLRINARTVANAYKELEIQGIIETRHGAGSFVMANAGEPQDGFRRDILARELDAVLLDACQMEFSFDELRCLFEERLTQAAERYASEREAGGQE